MLSPVLQFPQAQPDRVPRQARRLSHGRDAAVPQFLGFGSGPLASGTFVQHRYKGLKLAPQTFNDSCIMHPHMVADSNKASKINLAILFFRGS
jgi:hypothetical protein